MKRKIAKRLLSIIPVVLVVSTLVFFIIHLTPGSPADTILGEDATAEQIRALERELGLDQPIVVQWFNWIVNLARGNIGNSLYYGTAVEEVILNHVKPTVLLTVYAFVIAVVFGIAIGVFAAAFHNRLFDNILMFFASIGVSLPVSWLGLVLMLTFSLRMGWFPVTGYVGPEEDLFRSFMSLTLPAFTLGISPIARIARMTRANMLDVLKSDFIRTAKSKGAKQTSILFAHALKNAFVPTLTVMGLSLANMMGGAVVTEQIFGIPGIGRLLIFGVFNRDYPVVQGIVLYIALIYVAINLIIDIIYVLIDPRITYS